MRAGEASSTELHNNRTPAEVLEEKMKELNKKKRRFKKNKEDSSDEVKSEVSSNMKEELFPERESLRTPSQVLNDKVEESRRIESWVYLFKMLTATLLSVYLLLGVVFGLAIVQGQSMYPNLKTGDLVLFFRLNQSYKAGNVVILHLQKEKLVKRIVAVEGDTVDIEEETGQLLINGEVLDEEYVFLPTFSVREGIEFPLTVPEGSVFVLGDNRTASSDSRKFGLVPTEQIDGEMLLLFRVK